jgi:hypothetical protein
MQPVKVNAAIVANNVARTRVDFFMLMSPSSGQTSGVHMNAE